ncbi:MAG: hypothetical protein HDR22_06745 [Lachnospiraceae bacterium]|nr:hypothetical protein [Lachnospiraceae bacterium]
MKKKYYAVKQGKKTGLFMTWEECKKSVLGYPGAVFKAFSNIDDAKKYLKDNNYNKGECNSLADIDAYIDGSYDDNLKKYSYGIIIFYNQRKYQFSSSGNDKELVELRNVAGELLAAMNAMQFALEKEVRGINIYYDYQGIEMWATGNWKANLPFTKKYTEFSRMVMNKLKVNFIKIKSHSGNKYNDEVDLLAKEALYSNGDDCLKKISPVSNAITDENIFANDDICKNKGIAIKHFFLSNQMICLDDIAKEVKKRWKEQKRLLKEIKYYQSYFDVINQEFVIKICTEKDATIMKIKGDGSYGEK